jgi:hypothetical protein
VELFKRQSQKNSTRLYFSSMIVPIQSKYLANAS